MWLCRFALRKWNHLLFFTLLFSSWWRYYLLSRWRIFLSFLFMSQWRSCDRERIKYEMLLLVIAALSSSLALSIWAVMVASMKNTTLCVSLWQHHLWWRQALISYNTYSARKRGWAQGSGLRLTRETAARCICWLHRWQKVNCGFI